MSGSATTAWWLEGERFFSGALDRLAARDLDEPSLLAGWARRTVIAHVARNADALTNLLTWARTGVETPMYPSAQAREAGIADTARLPAGRLVSGCRLAAGRLAAAADELPASAWAAEVRTAHGHTVPAADIRWMRAREVWVHAVDLDVGLGFDDIPEDLLYALVDDVTRTWQRRGQTPDVRLSGGWRVWGSGTLGIAGRLPDLAAYLTGRGAAAPLTFGGQSAAVLPAWL